MTETNCKDITEVSSADLAYLGDSVLEVLVRKYLVLTPHSKNEHLSEKALKYVTAPNQSAAFENIEAVLTEEEADVFRRARNNYHTGNVPKSATPLQYRRATGLEALFGYLFLKDNQKRIDELFKIAYNL